MASSTVNNHNHHLSFILWFTILLIIIISGVKLRDAVDGKSDVPTIDSNGYIIYCPCMGRFGNQAEQFLGTLQFAKHLNRTLILPPFIEYVKYSIAFIPFGDYIQVQPLQEYHRVITMDHFMKRLAPIIWKEGSA